MNYLSIKGNPRSKAVLQADHDDGVSKLVCTVPAHEFAYSDLCGDGALLQYHQEICSAFWQHRHRDSI